MFMHNQRACSKGLDARHSEYLSGRVLNVCGANTRSRKCAVLSASAL
jgi:hypothetical protein